MSFLLNILSCEDPTSVACTPEVAILERKNQVAEDSTAKGQMALGGLEPPPDSSRPMGWGNYLDCSVTDGQESLYTQANTILTTASVFLTHLIVEAGVQTQDFHLISRTEKKTIWCVESRKPKSVVPGRYR